MAMMPPGYHELQDCAHIRTGLAFTQRLEGDSDGTHQVLLGRHLPPRGPYHFSPGDRLLVKPTRDPKPYIAQIDDVVFVARGAQNAATVLKGLSPDAPTVVTATFFLIRPNATIIPDYLAWYLNQTPARQFIDSARTGTTSPMIQRARFDAMPIPLLSMEEQRRVLYQIALMDEEFMLRQQALETTKRLHAAMDARLMDYIMSHARGHHGE